MSGDNNISKDILNERIRKLEDENLQLKESNSLNDIISFVLKDLPCILMITDSREGKILFINEYAKKTHNLEGDGIIVKTTLELGLFSSKEERDKVIKHFLIDKNDSSYLGVNFFQNKEHHYEIKSMKKILYNGQECFLTIASDVTQYVNIQNRLEESNQNLQHLLNEHSSIILLINPYNGEIVQTNPAAADFYGYSKDELIKKTIFDLNILAASKIKEKMMLALNNKHNIFQFAHKMSSGDIKYVEVHSSPVNYSGQKLLFSIIHDITDRRKTEKLLEESEERFKKLFELAPDPYYLNDMKGNFVDGNLAAEKILGYKKEELIGSNLLKMKILPPNFMAKAAKSLFMHTLGKPTGPDHFQLIRKNGETIDVEIMSTPIKIQGKKLVLGICRDIRKRISIENELKAQYNFMHMLINTIPIPFYYKDKDLKYLGCNRAFAKILGTQIKEVVGKTNHDLWPRETADLFYKKNLLLLKNRISQNFVTNIKDANGRDMTVIINASIYYGLDTEPAGILGLMQDITDLKKTEEDLKEAITAKNKFFSIIAHDIKSPLSGFIGLTKMLTEDTRNLSLSSIVDISENLHKSSGYLLKMLENLLYWAKLQQNSIELQPKTINISSVVDSVIQIFELNLKEKNITLVKNIDDIEIKTDLNMLEIVIRNLISNAIKFSEKDSRIEIFTTRKNGEISLSVKDHGIGITEENLNKLFKLDESFSTPGTNKEKGSGLGLIITKELIEKNGGILSVESLDGIGSTFTITFK